MQGELSIGWLGGVDKFIHQPANLVLFVQAGGKDVVAAFSQSSPSAPSSSFAAPEASLLLMCLAQAGAEQTSAVSLLLALQPAAAAQVMLSTLLTSSGSWLAGLLPATLLSARHVQGTLHLPLALVALQLAGYSPGGTTVSQQGVAKGAQFAARAVGACIGGVEGQLCSVKIVMNSSLSYLTCFATLISRTLPLPLSCRLPDCWCSMHHPACTRPPWWQWLLVASGRPHQPGALRTSMPGCKSEDAAMQLL